MPQHHILDSIHSLADELQDKQARLRRNLLHRLAPMQRHIDEPVPAFTPLSFTERFDSGIGHHPYAEDHPARIAARSLLPSLALEQPEAVQIVMGGTNVNYTTYGIIQAHPGLLDTLSAPETTALIGHELQHFNHRDVYALLIRASRLLLEVYSPRAIIPEEARPAADQLVHTCRQTVDLMELDADAAAMAASSPEALESMLAKVLTFQRKPAPETVTSDDLIAIQRGHVASAEAQYSATPHLLVNVRTAASATQRFSAIDACRHARGSFGIEPVTLDAILLLGATGPATHGQARHV